MVKSTMDKASCTHCSCEPEEARIERDPRDEAEPVFDDAVYFGGATAKQWSSAPQPAPAYHNGASRDGEVYSITIDKKVGGCNYLGLDIQVKEGGVLIIRDIQSGLIEQWNRANPKAQVLLGDRILEVNGAKDVASVMTTCRTDSLLRMLFQRAPSTPIAAPVSASFASGYPGSQSFYAVGNSYLPVGHISQPGVAMQPSSVSIKMPLKSP